MSSSQRWFNISFSLIQVSLPYTFLRAYVKDDVGMLYFFEAVWRCDFNCFLLLHICLSLFHTFSHGDTISSKSMKCSIHNSVKVKKKIKCVHWFMFKNCILREQNFIHCFTQKWQHINSLQQLFKFSWKLRLSTFSYNYKESLEF